LPALYGAGVLNPVGVLRHVAVGGSLIAAPVLTLAGLIGGGVHEERFEAKQVVVTPAGDGVRIRETVDDDFGTSSRHGYERIIPNDFGVPVDIEASSPDAPDDLSVSEMRGSTRIRIGDPDTTIDGQNRYLLSYTLPDAQLSSGVLALDIIGDPLNPEKLETGRFEVVLAGFELTDVTCNAGRAGTSGGCTLIREGDVYRAVIEPLLPGEGITVGGTIVNITTPVDVPIPEPVEHRSPSLPLAAGAAGLGAFAGLGGFLLARRLGRNEVGGAGAADAAYGAAGGPTRLVTDEEMDSMVTTEFVPPAGLRPWQGALLLTEKVDSDTVSAWFSDQIAQELLLLNDDKPQVLSAGPKLAQADPVTQSRLQTLLGSDGTLELGKYQPALEKLWKEVTEEQRQVAAASGWWKKFAPGTSVHFPPALTAAVGISAVIVGISVWQGWLRLWPLVLLAAFAVPAVVAGMAYAPLLPQRSATGSANALRTESFRRFLEASEGKHVDWAWQQGLLREYSAWAVALGAAAAWGRAVAASAVPPPQIAANTMPLIMYSNMGDWTTARHQPAPPSSGGSGGSGGFSGGFSGGGGGGGSSGNW
jgi:uncharacterized membrane protein YgcG